jgi:hypothetical protein
LYQGYRWLGYLVFLALIVHTCQFLLKSVPL